MKFLKNIKLKSILIFTSFITLLPLLSGCKLTVKAVNKFVLKKTVDAIYLDMASFYYTNNPEKEYDSSEITRQYIIYNNKNEILYKYTLSDDINESYKIIKDKVTNENSYYIIYKTNHKLYWYDNTIEEELDVKELHIYDAHNNEVIIEDNEYGLNNHLPFCSIGKYLIYDIKTDEITYYGADKSKIYYYDLENKKATLLIEDFAFNSIDCKVIDDYYFISLDCYISPENSKLKGDNKNHYFRMQNTNMYDQNFNLLHVFDDDIVYNIGIVNDVKFFMTYRYNLWGPSYEKRDMIMTYQMYRKFDSNEDFTPIFDDTILDLKHIGKEIWEVNDKGKRYLYNANNNKYVYDLDNNTEFDKYVLRGISRVSDMYIFDDGVVIERANLKYISYDSPLVYRLFDENGNKLNIESDRPIMQLMPMSKRTKNSLLIREKVTDKNDEERYLVRTLDKNIFSGIYEDEYKKISVMQTNTNKKEYEKRIICIKRNDNTGLVIDILTGDKLEVDSIDNIGVFIIKDNIYFIKYEDGKKILNFYKLSDPNNKIYFARGDVGRYLTNMGNVLVLTLVNYDKKGEKAYNNIVFNDDFSIKTKFDGDLAWRTFLGSKYIRIEIKDTGKVTYYDLDFNQIIDEEEISHLDNIYDSIYKTE